MQQSTRNVCVRGDLYHIGIRTICIYTQSIICIFLFPIKISSFWYIKSGHVLSCYKTMLLNVHIHVCMLYIHHFVCPRQLYAPRAVQELQQILCSWPRSRLYTHHPTCVCVCVCFWRGGGGEGGRYFKDIYSHVDIQLNTFSYIHRNQR